MESESKTSHRGISGHRSRRWEGKAVWRGEVWSSAVRELTVPVLVGIFSKRPERAAVPTRSPPCCPSFPGQARWLRARAMLQLAVAAVGQLSLCIFSSLPWISFVFSVTASLAVIIVVFAQLFILLAWFRLSPMLPSTSLSQEPIPPGEAVVCELRLLSLLSQKPTFPSFLFRCLL